jgi:hypothetical protein
MGFHHHYVHGPRLMPRLLGGASAATVLLGAETDGLSIDFTDMSAVVRDTGTPANNFIGSPAALLTYAAPSAKIIELQSGLLSSASTLRTAYSGGVAMGLLIEEARTNICLYARDLTQSNYTKTNATAALTATGVDGVANTASTLTASAANGSAFQRIVSASAARSLSMFVKRRTGTGTVSVAHGASTGSEKVSNGAFGTDTSGWSAGFGTTAASTFAASGGVATLTVGNNEANARYVTAVTVTAGKLYRLAFTPAASAGTGDVFLAWTDSSAGIAGVTLMQASAAGYAASGAQVFYGIATASTMYFACGFAGAAVNGDTFGIDNVSVLEVAETDITSSINSSTWTRVSITNETITNPCVAIKLATSGDAIDVDYCQSEVGAFVTSPIYTGSASVTRAADNITMATSVAPSTATAGTLYGSTSGFRSAGEPQIAALSDGTTNEYVFIRFNSSAQPQCNVNDGGVAQAAMALSAVTIANANKIAASWAVNDFAVSANGGAAGVDTSGTLPASTTLYIGRNPWDAASQPNGYIKQLMLLPRAMTDGELQTVTT